MVTMVVHHYIYYYIFFHGSFFRLLLHGPSESPDMFLNHLRDQGTGLFYLEYQEKASPCPIACKNILCQFRSTGASIFGK